MAVTHLIGHRLVLGSEGFCLLSLIQSATRSPSRMELVLARVGMAGRSSRRRGRFPHLRPARTVGDGCRLGLGHHPNRLSPLGERALQSAGTKWTSGGRSRRYGAWRCGSERLRWPLVPLCSRGGLRNRLGRRSRPRRFWRGATQFWRG